MPLTRVLLRDVMRGYSKSLLKRLSPSTSQQVGKNGAQGKKKRKKTAEASRNVDGEGLKKGKSFKRVKSSAANVAADSDIEDEQVGAIVAPANKIRERKLKLVAKSDVCSTSKHTKIKIPKYVSVSSVLDTNKEKTDIGVISPAGVSYSVYREELKRKNMIAKLVYKEKKVVGVSETDRKRRILKISTVIPKHSAHIPRLTAPEQKQHDSMIAPGSDTVSLKLKELSKTLCPIEPIIKLTDYAFKSTTQTLLVTQQNAESLKSVAVECEASSSLHKAKTRKSVATKTVQMSSKNVMVRVPMVVLPNLTITPPESPPHNSSTATMCTPPRATSHVPVGLIPKLENISPPVSCDGDVRPANQKIMVPLVERMLSLTAPNTVDPAVTVESSACASVSVSQKNSSTHPIEARKGSRVCSLLPLIVRSNVKLNAFPSTTASACKIIASDRKSSPVLKSTAAPRSRMRSTLKTPRMIRAAERAVIRFSPTVFSKSGVKRKTLSFGRRSGLQEETRVSSTLEPAAEVIMASPPTRTGEAIERLLNDLNDSLRGKKDQDFNASRNGPTSAPASNESQVDCGAGTLASNEPGLMQNESAMEPQQETHSFCIGSETTTKGLRKSLLPSAVQSLPAETSRVVTAKVLGQRPKKTEVDLQKEGNNNKRQVSCKRITRINRVPKKKAKKATALTNLASSRNNNIEIKIDDVTKKSNDLAIVDRPEIIKNLLDSVMAEYRKKRKKSSPDGIANCCWLCGNWKVKLCKHLRSKHADAFVRRKERGLSPNEKDRLVKKRTKQCYDTAIMLRRVQRYPFSKIVLRRRYDEAEWERCKEGVLRSTEALGFKVMSGARAWRWKAIAGKKNCHYDFFVED